MREIFSELMLCTRVHSFEKKKKLGCTQNVNTRNIKAGAMLYAIRGDSHCKRIISLLN